MGIKRRQLLRPIKKPAPERYPRAVETGGSPVEEKSAAPVLLPQ